MGCENRLWNDPYPHEDPKANTLYLSFTDRPKHLDPARSYTSSEWRIIAQIYEPPLQYQYLKRPYVLEPLTAASLPEISYAGHNHEILSGDPDPMDVAYTDYLIRIKPGIFYEKHPAFAKSVDGKYLYHHLTPKDAEQYHVLSDFPFKQTREVTAYDFVYQIKRLADPQLSSPIYGFMSRYIVGLSELRKQLLKTQHEHKFERDLRSYQLLGVKAVNRYVYRIRLRGKYPQFMYWLAMPFFAPIPWEVTQFYAQEGLAQHNISLDWYPVGTGPFRLEDNDPERRMVLVKNTEFRAEYYPKEGELGDEAKGLLADAGKRLPLLDKVLFTLEKEDIPYWNKFLQGYYDLSGIGSDNFNSSIQFSQSGEMRVSELLSDRGIQLQMSTEPSVWYWGFNMLNETVGGYSNRGRKLRQAIAMAFNIPEFLTIFMNDRGIPATGPIPPGIFGYETQGKYEPGNLELARKLLIEAGYPTGLTLRFDTVSTGNPDEIAQQAWIREQFTKLGVQVVFRSTDYNRFQEKVRLGNVEMFFMGWNADYPDPENFLFLLYGPNGSVHHGGENASNYQNVTFDRLFEQMRYSTDNAKRYQLIEQMQERLREDQPWIWGFYPKSFTLYHDWVGIRKPSGIITNTLKYTKINPDLRAKLRTQWNQPVQWPLGVIFGLIPIVGMGLYARYRKQERQTARRG